MEKILSIVIPTYNMEAYLSVCLDSLTKSEKIMNDLEVIVVNDGSKDNSLQIAQKYMSSFPDTVVVIDKENGNYGSCVNKALTVASGKYFRIIDADDWANTPDLEKLIAYLKESEVDLVLTNHKIVYKDTERFSSFPAELNDKVFDIDDFNMLEYGLEWLILMHRMTYKTSLLKECGLHLHEGISYSDTDYCFYPCIKAKDLVFKDLVIYCYNCSRDGQTMSLAARSKSLSHMTTILEELVKTYLPIKDSISQHRKYILLECFGNCTHSIYQTLLIDSKKNKENDKLLKYVDSLLKEDNTLYEHTAKFTYNGIKQVKIWRKFGLYNTNFIFRCYNFAYYRIQKIKGMVTKN